MNITATKVFIPILINKSPKIHSKTKFICIRYNHTPGSKTIFIRDVVEKNIKTGSEIKLKIKDLRDL